MTKKAPVTLKTSINLLTLSVFLGLLSATAVANNNTNTVNQTLVANTNANPKTPDGKEVRSSDQPAQFNEVANKQAREYLTKYGRLPSTPLMTYVSMSALSGMAKADLKVSSLFGVVRASDEGNHYHGGHDFANGIGVGGKYPLYAPTSGSVFYSSNGGFGLIRDNLSTKDRVVHLHLKVAGSKGKRVQGTQLQNYSQYGSPIGNAGTLIGYLHGLNSKGVVKYAVHDHAEYHVRAGDPRVAVKLYRGVLATANRNNHVFRDLNLIRSNSMISKTDKNYRQIDIAPYMAYDTEIQVPKIWNWYSGNTLFTNFNNLYKTQLPEGLLSPTTKGGQPRQMKSVKKALPITYFTQSAFANMDISMEQLGSANMAIMDYAINAENAGFDVQGQLITQKMLVSHMSDENGETWQSVFGTAESVSPNEMNQADLVRHLANKRLGNEEWYSKIITLSDKGVFMEFMAQRAEINFMYGLLTKLKQEQIKQDAILASVMMNHKDKAVTDLGEIINASVAPDFASVQLEKKGDEWAIDEVYSEGGTSGDYTSSGGSSVDFTLPADIKVPDKIRPLVEEMVELISKHEGGSWDAYNTGAWADNKSGSGLKRMKAQGCYMKSFFSDSDVAKAVAQGGKRPTEMTLREIASVGKYSICPPNILRTSAVGKYQIMYFNVGEYIRKNPDLANHKFTPDIQNRMLLEFFLLGHGRSTKNLIMAGRSVSDAKNEITRTWASVCWNGKTTGAYKQKCSPENTQKLFALVDKIAQAHK